MRKLLPPLLAVAACLAPPASASDVLLSMVKETSVVAQPGAGAPVIERGGEVARASAVGNEDTKKCQDYGRRSSADGLALVEEMPDSSTTALSFKVQASARANGGHFRTGSCLAGRWFGFSGNDTESTVVSRASATVRVRFEGGRANEPYFLKVSKAQAGASVTQELFDPDGKSVPLTTTGSPYPVILGRPGQEYFLRTTVTAEARNGGGCCSEQADGSALIKVAVEPAPLLFGSGQVGYIVGGRQTEGHKNVAIILLEGMPHCTATLVSPRTFLTAAHCIERHMTGERLAAGKVSVAFGSVYTQPIFPPIEVHEAAFPNSGDMVFDRPTLRHDIGLVHVKDPIKHVGVKPAQLHEGHPTWQQVLAKKTNLIFVGFGFNVIDEEKVGLGIKREAAWSISDVRDLSVSFSVPGKNTCMGDSGGPGFIESSQRLRLAAITSGGDSLCTSGFDTRVDAYLAWLKPRIR